MVGLVALMSCGKLIPPSGVTVPPGTDTTAPFVTSVTTLQGDGIYSFGDVIEVVVNFSEEVVVSGTPTLELETGLNDTLVDFTRTVAITQSAARTGLVFDYTVGSSDGSSALDYVATDSFRLNGGGCH